MKSLYILESIVNTDTTTHTRTNRLLKLKDKLSAKNRRYISRYCLTDNQHGTFEKNKKKERSTSTKIVSRKFETWE